MKFGTLGLLFCAMLLLGGSCCRKEPVRETFYIPHDVLDYVYFDTGSWWKYKDTDTEVIDSSYIINARLSLYETANHKSQLCEFVHVIRSSNYFSQVYYIVDSEKPEAPTVFQLSQGAESGVGYNFFYCTFGCDTNPAWSSWNPQDHSARERLDSATVQGRTYYDVMRIYNTSPFPTQSSNEIWYARHIGVIKRKFFDGTTWELVGHHATQAN